MKKINKKHICVFLSASSIIGCNSGTNSNGEGTNNIQKRNIIRNHQLVHHTNDNYLSGYSITNGKVLSKNQLVALETKILKTDVENNGPSSIGWNSATNTRAPANCYNYQASYIPDPNGASSKLYVNGDASSFYEKAGVNVSYSGPSIKAALAAKINLSSQQSGGFVEYNAMLKRDVTFSNISLNSLGQKYANNPSEFLENCGDSVITTAQIFISAATTASISSAASTDKIFASISGSDGISGFSSIAAKLSSKTGLSSSGFNINTSMIEYGSFNGVDISSLGEDTASCFPNSNDQPSDNKKCQSSLTTMLSDVSIADNNAFNLISDPNGNNYNQWASFYLLDHTPNNLNTVPATNYLPNLSGSPSFAKYANIVKQNQYVLEDLAVIGSILDSNINPVLSNMFGQSSISSQSILLPYTTPSQNVNYFQDPYFNAVVNNGIYNIDSIWNDTLPTSYATLVENCINSRGSSKVNENCALLPQNPTVDSIINQYYPQSLQAYINTPGTNNFISTATNGLLTTIHDLMYSLNIGTLEISSAQDNNGNYKIQKGNLDNGYFVAIPFAKSDTPENTDRSFGLILAIPATTYNNPNNPQNGAYNIGYKVGAGAYFPTFMEPQLQNGINGNATGFYPIGINPSTPITGYFGLAPGIITGNGVFSGMTLSTYEFSNTNKLPFSWTYGVHSNNSSDCPSKNFGSNNECTYNWSIADFGLANGHAFNHNFLSNRLEIYAKPNYSNHIFNTLYPLN